MNVHSLRFKIAATISIVCILLASLIGSILYAASEALEESLVEQLVTEELNFLIQHYQLNPHHQPETSSSVQYFTYKVSDMPEKVPAFARDLADGAYEIDERHVAVKTVGDTRFVVLYDLGEYEDREEEYKMLVGALLLLMVLTAPIMGWLLSRALISQLTSLTNKVEGLSPNAQAQLLFHPSLGSEVGILAGALDRFQAKFAEMLKREQEFTANVSHELRTPLTEIRTSCELLARDETLSEKSRRRVAYIAQAEQDMRAHMEALLFLARDQTQENNEIVALAECIQDIATPLQREIQAKGLQYAMHIEQDVLVTLNRRALHLVVFNLLKNAVAYTEHGEIEVRYDDGRLTIADTGIGIEPEVMSKIFDRHYRVDDKVDGFGIGLNIVQRVTEHEGWGLDVRSCVEGGTIFSLRLPQSSSILITE